MSRRHHTDYASRCSKVIWIGVPSGSCKRETEWRSLVEALRRNCESGPAPPSCATHQQQQADISGISWSVSQSVNPCINQSINQQVTSSPRSKAKASDWLPGIAHFLCAMHAFEVQASSPSSRLPLCQISFLSWPPLLS